jgi:hypothetical protein
MNNYEGWGTRPFGWCFKNPGGFVGFQFLWWHGGVARKYFRKIFFDKVERELPLGGVTKKIDGKALA